MPPNCPSACAFFHCFSKPTGEQCGMPRLLSFHFQQSAHRHEFGWRGGLHCSSRFRQVSHRHAAPSSSASPAYPEGFDLGTAIALAGCSFEAYLEPENTAYLESKAVNDVEVIYTSRGSLQKIYDGYLRIELKRASGLPARDFLGKSDPYVVLSVGESLQTSKTISQELNPVWNEVFELYVRNSEKDVLRMRVRDADDLKSDDELGTAMFPVNKFQSEEMVDFDLPLQGDGGGGTLSISGKFVPLQDSELEKNEESSVQLMDVDELSEALKEVGLPKVWRDLAILAGKEADERFDPVCYVHNSSSDTQVWIYTSNNRDRKNEIVVAFRGTEQNKWKDIATDANLQLSTIDYERTDQSKLFTNRLYQKSSEEPLVHKGFLDAYDSIRASLISVIDGIIGDGKDWRIFCTGHSLGGALATLSAYELAARRNKFAEVTMYNYGSPRVGNQVFADEFNAHVSTSWRITNPKDVVTSMPRFLGYAHVQTNVVIEKNGILTFCANPKKDAAEGRVILDVVSNSLASSSIEKVTEVIEPIIKEEMDLLTSMADGSGLAEHMEDLYLAGLVECVSLARGESDQSQ